jgi:hypothetical protein
VTTRKKVYSVLDDNWLNMRYLVERTGNPRRYIIVFSDYSAVRWWPDTGKVTPQRLNLLDDVVQGLPPLP